MSEYAEELYDDEANDEPIGEDPFRAAVQEAVRDEVGQLLGGMVDERLEPLRDYEPEEEAGVDWEAQEAEWDRQDAALSEEERERADLARAEQTAAEMIVRAVRKSGEAVDDMEVYRLAEGLLADPEFVRGRENGPELVEDAISNAIKAATVGSAPDENEGTRRWLLKRQAEREPEPEGTPEAERFVTAFAEISGLTRAEQAEARKVLGLAEESR